MNDKLSKLTLFLVIIVGIICVLTAWRVFTMKPVTLEPDAVVVNLEECEEFKTERGETRYLCDGMIFTSDTLYVGGG